MIRSLFLALGLVIATIPPLGAGASAQTAASNWVDEDFASLRLISARDAINGRDEIRLGLEFELKPDWKIYWRSAGDAGFPPQLDWAGSTNIGDGQIRWPAPHRFSIFGLETFGYKDHIILPIDVPVTDPAQAAHIELDVDYLVCSDVCIPAQANFTLDIPASLSDGANGDTAGISRFAHDIEKFASRVPLRGDNLPMSVSDIWQSTAQSGENDQTVLNVAITGLDQTASDPVEILIEGNVRLGFGVPVPTATDAATGTQQFRIPIYGLKDDQTTIGDDVIVTVIAGPLAIEQDRQIAAAPSGSTTTSSNATPSPGIATTSLWLLGALALLGGFILNFMPCVLPVLSLKVMSAMKAQGSARSATRRGFLASAAGIITSFWLIAAVLIAIKLAGGTIGWGIQFQQPLFLTVMTIIVALFAFNMWGLFEINGPAELGNAANDTITAREKSGHHLGGHFLTGMFATLLATPCSAPFLGTAVGFALAGSSFDIFWIFTLLGIGLAVPYLAIAARPEIARLLPKPGRWMGFVKGILGVALAGTAIWLLSVLAVQIGMAGAIAVGIALVMAGILLFARHRTTVQKRKYVFTALATLGVLAALFAPGFSKAPLKNTASRTSTETLPWRPFAPDEIARHVADGKTVLVDITAEWCVTCQVNKKLVLETDDMTAALTADDVILMQGDWTRPDPVISQYLAGYGRYGIPFNAVFGPKAPDGVLLSELLGKQEVLDAIARASGGTDLVKK